jgi:transcriptional regulator GlxA family with amidase domain
MFGAADCDVFTVAATKAPVTSAMGLTMVPTYSFADAPQAAVLVIPGGGVASASRDEATLRFIKQTHAKTEFTMSVCNGAFILARTGLLDGLDATTTRGNLRPLGQQFPKVRVKPDQRYTDNGRIITTGGLSAGIDGALHVIEKLFGADAARQVARAEEYHWIPGTALPPAPKLAPHRAGDPGPVYVCPMREHAGEFIGPGECPECNMALEPKKEAGASH